MCKEEKFLDVYLLTGPVDTMHSENEKTAHGQLKVILYNLIQIIFKTVQK